VTARVTSSSAAARELSNTLVGNEHLLLGVLRLGDHPAAASLSDLGITLDAARAAVFTLWDSGHESTEVDREIERVLEEALRAGCRGGANRVGVEDLLDRSASRPGGRRHTDVMRPGRDA
jgi:hypothetical protein